MQQRRMSTKASGQEQQKHDRACKPVIFVHVPSDSLADASIFLAGVVVRMRGACEQAEG